MKKHFIALTIILSFCLVSFSQNIEDEVQKLQRQISLSLEKGNLDETISIAEKIVEIEKKGGEKNLIGYSMALMNLGLWKKQRLETAIPNMRISKDEIKSAKKIFQELMLIFQTRLGEPLQLATAQSELAELYFNFPDNSEEIGEAEKLFLNSLSLREKHLGEDNDSTISIIFKMAGFYFQNGEFEQYLPHIKRFILLAEKKYGEKDKRLIPALRQYAGFLLIADREIEARQVVQKIAVITGRPELSVLPGRLVLKRARTKISLQMGKVPNIVKRSTSAEIANSNPMLNGSRVVDVRDGRGTSTRVVVAPDLPSSPGKIDQSDFGDLVVVPKNAIRVVTFFSISEKGEVNGVIPQITDQKIKKKIIETIEKWKFRPLIYEGVESKMRSVVTIIYYP